MHVDKKRIKPQVEHLVSPPPKPNIQELNLDVPTQGYGCRQRQFCIRVRSPDILVRF